MTDDELATARQAFQQWTALAAQAFEALQREVQPIIREIVRLWQHIARWIQRQGPLSPALAYVTPAMRRRAARQRAHLAMQAKHRGR